jgi:hypothetical protein
MRISGHTKREVEATASVNATLGMNPALAPDLLKLLEAAGDDKTCLSALVNKALIETKNALPEESKAPRTKTTKTIAPHKMCSLSVRELALDMAEVSFTIPKGMSGEMVLAGIEKANPRAAGDGVVWPDSVLLKDAGLSKVMTEDTTFTITVCFESNNRNKDEQVDYLKKHDLVPTDRAILTLAAALYRDEKGFPSNRNDIGTSKDHGDLFKGKVVRALSGALSSFLHGLDDYARFYIDDLRNAAVVAAGSSPSNQKI